MDKDTRNILRNVVTNCRHLLEEAVAQVLEGQYGVYESGIVEDAAKMDHLTPDELDVRERIVTYLEHIQSGGFKAADAADQLIREIAFTHLNRLAAYKMMEQRDLIREAVSRGLDSQGFKFYLAYHPDDERLWSTGQQDIAYRHFLVWQGEQFAHEIAVLFSLHDPANFVFPPQRVLDQVLDLINSAELVDIWTADETIGWIYQYFTPKELRDKARSESQAPRNSYELAFRNQFYTPRYVVEFLTDNTLGRTWHEMRQGSTVLAEQCRYLVRRPNEIFLAQGENAPESDVDTSALSQAELLQQPVYIPYRATKDPRRLKVLDPACGSGHFLLYAFDLLATIYEEAWQDNLTDPASGMNLREDYTTLDALRCHIPRLILRHNLHGIDIDRRATQIAALALWLRAQRYYNDNAISRDERPAITQGNIVVAEPMPGDRRLLDEFTAELESPIDQMVKRVFNEMKLAGEAGSLLKIEEAIQEDIATARKEWERGLRQQQTSQQMALLPDWIDKKPEQLSLFDVSKITDAEFFDRAEHMVLDALEAYAQRAENGHGLRRKLFAEDAAGGFAFIEVLRKHYDAVLMNPPFGAASTDSLDYLRSNYRIASDNLLVAFVVRFHQLLSLQGRLGAITDRSFVNKRFYEDFRRDFIVEKESLEILIDLGWEVLDAANVEVAMHVHSTENALSFFANLGQEENKSENLLTGNKLLVQQIRSFRSFPGFAIVYDLDEPLVQTFDKGVELAEHAFKSFGGLKAGSSDHLFRLIWEVPIDQIGPSSTWALFQNGSPFAPYYFGCNLVVRCDSSTWNTVMSYDSSRITNSDRYFEPGLSYGKRTDLMYAYIMRANQVPSMEGHAIFPVKNETLWKVLLVVNSSPYQEIVNHLCGQHKYAGYVNAARLEIDKYPNEANEIRDTVIALEKMDTGNEVAWVFCIPTSLGLRCSAGLHSLINDTVSYRRQVAFAANQFRHDYNCRVNSALNWSTPNPNLNRDTDYTEVLFGTANTDVLETHNLLSYVMGSVLGRWDIRYATGEQFVPDLPDPFDPLPVCPLGMLQTADGLPATETPPGYPLDIDWDGILVDDPDHPDDIIRRVRGVLEVLWGDHAEAIEQEACEILGVKDLRDYFRKPGNSGFWMDHVKRYSKSRRNAPIYWLLQSSRKNYALWLYYHRLDKDLYYKALINYVQPKLRLEQNQLDALRVQLAGAGVAGREAKRLSDAVGQQEALMSELQDFHDALERAANLNLDPDLNDGVVLNIAPLHELVPWGEAQKYWDELLKGEYEWSTISQQLHERGLVK